MRNEKARRFLLNMRKKPGVNFEAYFPRADAGAIALLRRMLAFDPADRPTSESALADPYFAGLSQPGREPAAQPVSKMAFEFERRKLQVEEVGAQIPHVIENCRSDSHCQIHGCIASCKSRDIYVCDVISRSGT